MKKVTLFAVIAALGSLMLATSGFSGTQKGDFFFSPMIGGHIFEGNLDPFDINEEFDHGITFALGLGYKITDQLGTELFINATDTETDPSDVESEVYPIHLDLFYDLVTDKALVPYVAAGLGTETFCNGDLNDDTDFMVNYGGGVKYFFQNNLALRADVRHLISFDDTHNQLIYMVGLVVPFSGEKKAAPVADKDSDGDGVMDSKDACPGTAKGVKVNSKGCPVDSDHDGVTDDQDGCPDTPEGEAVDKYGCPEIVKEADSDNDGVIDSKDGCPDTPVGVAVDKYGCPETNVVAGVDTDSDGVTDDKDACEGTPKGATVDARGCWVIKNLKFESGKAEILSSSHKDLDEVVAVLKANPDLKLEIQGYTDNRGAAEFNRALSGKRANAVKDYMVSKGVNAGRLSAKGYGIENPVATNDTAEGRAQNRRVELNPIY